MPVTVNMDWNSNAIMQDLAKRAETALNAAGQVGEGIAQQNARVRTGFMRESVYFTVTTLPGGWTLILGDSAPYAIFNELGTIYMAAQPFIRPGGDAAAKALPQLLSNGGNQGAGR